VGIQVTKGSIKKIKGDTDGWGAFVRYALALFVGTAMGHLEQGLPRRGEWRKTASTWTRGEFSFHWGGNYL